MIGKADACARASGKKGEKVANQPSGACLCGAVQFEVHGALRDVVNCHCSLCRRWHGHYAAYTATARDALRIIDDEQLLGWYRSPGNAASRGFCTRCGSSLFWQRDHLQIVSIAAGGFNAPTGLVSSTDIFVADKGDYYLLDNALDQRARGLASHTE